MKTQLTIALVALTLTSACGGGPKGKAGPPASGGGASVAADSSGSTHIPEAAPQATVSPEIAGQLEQGQREAAAGNLDAARRAYESAASTDSSAPEPLYNLGVLAERQGNDVEARRYYKQALDARPEFGPAVTAIAQIMLRKGDAAAALSFAQERLEKAPESTGVRNAVARLKLANNDVAGAIADATAVLRTDERNVEAMKVLGAGYARQGKHELALSVLASASANDPNDPEPYAKMARSHVALNEKPQARLQLEKAVALPGGASAEVYNDLGLIYHEAGDFAGAEGMFRQSLSRHPQFLAAQMNLGNALKGQQKYADADAAMKRALELNPNSGDVLFNLGILYLDGQLPGVEPLSRLQQAVDFFQRYKQAPGRPAANDPVDQYIAEANKRIVVEQKKAEAARKDPKPAPAPAPASADGGEK